MISEAAVIRKPLVRLPPSRCYCSATVTLTVILRNARSFMSSVRGQVITFRSRSSSLLMKQVRVDQSRQQVVSGGNRTEIAMEVEIDLLRGLHL